MLGKHDVEIHQFITQDIIWFNPTPFEKEIINTIALGNSENFKLLFAQSIEQSRVHLLGLMACAYFGQLKIYKTLYKHPTVYTHLIFLELAAQRGHLDLVKFILGYYVNQRNDASVYSKALSLAAEHGHLKIVNCMIKEYQINPNNLDVGYIPSSTTGKGPAIPVGKRYSDSMPNIRHRCQALYLAAMEGHIDVVCRLLDDPRTGYFDLEHMSYNSPNEKAFLIAITTLINVLLNENLDPRFKRQWLFEISAKLLFRNQQNDLVRLLKHIQPVIKEKLFIACYGKKAPSKMIEGQETSLLYGSHHAEIQLLIHSSVERLSDGSLKLNYDKSNGGTYSINYSSKKHSKKLNLVEELSHLCEALGYKFSALDKKSITFTAENSIVLREVHCLHYNAAYLTNLVYFQSGLRQYYDFYNSMRRVFTQVTKEIWCIIGNYFMQILYHIGLNIGLDSSDQNIIFMADYIDASPSYFLFPPTKTAIEIPLKDPQRLKISPIKPEPLDKRALFLVIYKALYNGQSSFFKHWNNDLMDKEIETENMIRDYIAEKPNSRTAIAWDLTINFIEGSLTKKGLFQEIHQQSFKNSSNLGIFKQSVFENGFDGFEQRIKRAKKGKLEGTRTKDIIDALASHPALSL